MCDQPVQWHWVRWRAREEKRVKKNMTENSALYPSFLAAAVFFFPVASHCCMHLGTVCGREGVQPTTEPHIMSRCFDFPIFSRRRSSVPVAGQGVVASKPTRLVGGRGTRQGIA